MNRGRKGRIALDIGCNKGNVIQQLLDNNYDLVVGIDADIRCVNHCKERFKNEIKVLCYNYLICDESNTDRDFYQANKSIVSTASTDWMTNCRFAGKMKWKKVKVPTLTLHDAIDYWCAYADFIKIDVEGYEFEVIKSLKYKQGVIGFEWSEENFDYVAKPCIEHLKKLGYTRWYYTNRDTLTFKYDWQKELNIGDIIPSRKKRWGMVFCK